MPNRIATVAWPEGDGWVLGINWAGVHEQVSLKLSDLQANGDMMPDAFVVRLPRRFVTDYRGRVYRSEQERQRYVREFCADMRARDRASC